MRMQTVGFLAAVALLAPGRLMAQTDPPPEHREGQPAAKAFEFSGFTVQGFSDVTFRADRFIPLTGDPSTSNTFGLGQFSLFLSARIAENVAVVSETAFELSNDERQSQSIEIERLYIKYVLSDAFKLAAGRTHTALGYWNEAYHHGALLQPTVSRPEILRFGGVMPLHSVGVEVSGRFAASAWDINYIANFANGRARDFSVTQGAVDVNRQKAVAVKLSFAHQARRTFIFGPMFYRDVIPADPTKPTRLADLTETIPGFHVVYRDPRLELLSEYFRIRHVNRVTAEKATHEGWYAIGVLRSWRIKPYAGIDVAEFASGQAYFAGGDASVRRYLAGARYDVNPFNALKFEYRYEDRASGVTHALVINTAFAF